MFVAEFICHFNLHSRNIQSSLSVHSLQSAMIIRSVRQYSEFSPSRQ